MLDKNRFLNETVLSQELYNTVTGGKKILILGQQQCFIQLLNILK